MPIPIDAESTLRMLFTVAGDREIPVIREVARRAGLYQHCRCGEYNPVSTERCSTCRTRVLPETQPQTAPALGLLAVRCYLTEVHGDDGDARFVAACGAGHCGGLALDVSDDVAAGAEHHGYSHRWPVIAEEIIAGVEVQATADGAAQAASATTS